MIPLEDWFFTPRCVFCERILGAGSTERICPWCHPEEYLLKPPFCPVCGKTVGKEGDLCRDCFTRRPTVGGRALYRYDGLIRDALHRLKYDGRRDYARFFGKLLWEQERAFLEDFAPDALVPVPLHRRRRRERGYNQAEELAKALSAASGIPVRDLLYRGRATAAQMSLNALLRGQNTAGAFGVYEGEELPRRILLIDDIYTTGSTVEACAAAIRAKAAGLRAKENPGGTEAPEPEIRFLTVALTLPPQNPAGTAPDAAAAKSSCLKAPEGL